MGHHEATRTGGPGEREPEAHALRDLELLGTSPDASAALQRIARIAAGLLRAPAAVVHLTGPHGRGGHGAVGEDVLTAPAARLCAAVSDDRTALLLPEIGRDDPRGAGAVAAFAGRPLRLSSGAPAGALAVADARPRKDWDAAALALLGDLADAATSDLELRRSLLRADEDLRFSVRTAHLLHLLAGSAPLGDLLAEVVDALERHVPGARAAVIGLDRDGRRHTLWGPRVPAALLAAADGSGADAFDVLDPALVVHEDVAGVRGWKTLGGLAREAGIAASWSLGLRAPGGGVIGRLTVYASEHRPPDERERVALHEAAELAAAAIERRRVDAALDEVRRRDELTGLPNRVRLVEDLEDAVSRHGASVLALFDLEGLRDYTRAFGHAAGDSMLRRLAARLVTAMRGRGRAYRLGDDEFAILSPAGTEDPATLVARGIDALSAAGEGFTLRATAGSVVVPDEAVGTTEALTLADARLSDERRARAAGGDGALSLLLAAMREREAAGGAEEELVGLVLATARRLGVRGEELAVTAAATRLRDVGMVAMPEALLDAHGPLGEDTWGLVRTHPLVGQRIVAAAPELADAARIVRSTHECWDGTGYPDGLAGHDIPLAARVIAACEAYAAMTSARPHRDPATPDEALAELRRCAGTQFDPRVVERLREALGETRAEAGDDLPLAASA